MRHAFVHREVDGMADAPTPRATRAWSIVACACLLAFPDVARALEPNREISSYYHRNWTHADGLPQNSVRAIAQTPDGYLWLATEEGLARFDGARFRVFSAANTPTIRNSLISALTTDRAGVLWIGTADGNVYRMIDGTFERFPVSSTYVARIVVDAQSRIWVGSFGGLSVIERGEIRDIGREIGLIDAVVVEILASRDGSIWIGTSGSGLYRWTGDAVSRIPIAPGFNANVVSALHEDRAGRIWIGTRNGLLMLADGKLAQLSFGDGTPMAVLDIVEGDGGSVWVGADRALLRFDETRLDAAPSIEKRSDPVLCVARDIEGSVWTGSQFDGLGLLADSVITSVATRGPGSTSIVSPLVEDSAGSIWMGTMSFGVDVSTDTAIDVAEINAALTDHRVRAMHEYPPGTLWVSTRRGVARVVAGRATPFLHDGKPVEGVAAIVHDRAGHVWFGKAGGLLRVSGDGVRTDSKQDGLASDYVSVLAASHDGGLWIGTPNAGLGKLEGDVYRRIGEPEGLATESIMALLEDDDHVLWATSTQSGLIRVAGRDVARFGSRAGLPSQNIYSLVDDGRGSLWMCSNAGISQLRLDDFARAVASNAATLPLDTFGRADGMPSEECSGFGQPGAMRTRDGRLWFATMRGAVVLDPRTMQAPQRAPPLPVIVEELRADGRTFPAQGRATLSSTTGLVEIDYTGLSVIGAERVRFRYRLNGLERTWQDAGARRTAYYTALPAGTYRLDVEARLGDEPGWHAAQRSIEFRIPPVFYRTFWFRLAVFLAFAFVVALVVRVWLIQWRARAALLEERTRIAQEVHDGLAQMLGGAVIQLQVAAGADDPMRHVEIATRMAEKGLDELRRSIGALRPEPYPSHVDLEQSLRDLAETIPPPPTIELVVTGADGVPAPLAHHLLRIAQEAVSNARRHGDATKISVRLRGGRRRVELSIVDDGKGFDLPAGNAAASGFGLQSLRLRAATIGATLSLRSEPGHGTSIVLSAPLKNGLLHRLWRLGAR
jgi:ligand-binding sensor domain-containing protein/signal transduction histidine kinase